MRRSAQGSGNDKGAMKTPLLDADYGNGGFGGAGHHHDKRDGIQMHENASLAVSFEDSPQLPMAHRNSEPEDMSEEVDSGPVHLSLVAAIAKTKRVAGALRRVGDGGAVEAVPTMRGDDVGVSLHKLGFTSLLQLIPTEPGKVGTFAICEATESERLPLTHHRLLGFLRYEVDLFRFGISVRDRCAILMPNGPELAVCLLLCVSRCTCVPINHQQTPPEVRALLQGTEAKALIVLHDEDDERVEAVVQGLEVEVLNLRPSSSFQGLFSLTRRKLAARLAPGDDGKRQEEEHTEGSACAAAKRVSHSLATPTLPLVDADPGQQEADADPEGKGSRRRWRAGEGAVKRGGFLKRARRHLLLNGPQDEALILHTSGTSAACKRVPYSLENLCVGAACIVASWELGRSDVCFNMMPLFHVGGISRNVLAPILSGGGVVCAPMLDPALFWEALGLRGVSWYYAGPTMHQIILEEMPNHVELLNVNRGGKPLLRFVANASGGLSEALAERMHTAFGCPVLPCYGMTECMPVSSPPMAHPVLHPASSGQVVGPRVRIMGGDGQWLGAEEVGEVVLKGLPVIGGYLGGGAAAANARSFTEEGWFRTGDMGLLLEGGWLALTGRCKEVINRGGELISPLEVEEVVVRHPMVREVMAFSCPHSVLQEVVAVAIVPMPSGGGEEECERRVDLGNLQRFVSESLHPSKWPQVIVFLDKLPKGNAMKVQRIGVAERMALAPLTDGEGQAMRMFEGQGPPPGAPLEQKIAVRRVAIDVDEVTRAVRSVAKPMGVTESAAVTCPMPGEKGSVGILLYVSPASLDPFTLKEMLRPLLHDYLVPVHITALDVIPADPALLAPPPTGRELDDARHEPRTETERRMQRVWAELLGREVGIDSDFFHSGGTSLLAGRLVAQVRAVFGVPMTAATLFKHRSVEALAKLTEGMLEAAGGKGEDSTVSSLGRGIGGSSLSLNGRKRDFFPWWEVLETEGQTRSQNSLAAKTVQLLPLAVLYPLRRVVTWTAFISIWLFLLAEVGMNRLAALIVALAAAGLVAEIAFPVFFLLCKWVIIGRYRPGRYPLWGQYYLRWWFVEKLQQLCGRGIFRHTNWSLCLYYRMLGAKIGRGVKIDPRADVSEFDLINIGARCSVDNVRVSAFYIDQYAMVLETLEIGERSSVPCKVSLVPGIQVPPNTAFGPLSSSYEIGDGSTTDGVEDGLDGNARYCRQNFPEPAWYLKLFGYLVMLLVWLVEQIPVLILLRLIVIFPWYMKEIKTYLDVLHWFLTPERIGYYVALRVLRTTALPLLRVAMCIVVKRVLVGKFTEGRRTRSEWNLFRHWLMAKLLPGEKLQTAAHLVGAHYEGVSVILRCLGAKVGKRVYWPGTGLQGLVEYDLLEVGDDVVFGSRTHVMACDAVAARRVRILAGANVGDRCVLLPGCTVGQNALLGSGGLGGRGQVYRAHSKWVGSQGGAAVVLDAGRGCAEGPEEGSAEGDKETLRPFGKAMYKGLAPYVVLPGWFHGVFTALTRSVAASWRALTLIAAFEITRLWLGGGEAIIGQPVTLRGIAERITPLFFLAHNAATLLALFVCWLCKWMVMGRRRPGEFDWDKSSYCQRWQLYLSLTGIIRAAYFGEGVLDLLHGSVYLVWWFRALGAKIGREVCLYPRGADPMMTEPDLVHIGSFACVDSASVIAHINSRGSFALHPISVGAGANLRADSRLLSGAAMMPGSTLLEHTLVLGGDVVDEGATWQGWPGQTVVPQTPSGATPSALTPSLSRERLDALDRV